ncbi:efflux RND transporter periplasmic adaptor subunit [Mangrovibacterium marinum]|uniref:RND family efflux transporter MFP subunit n=1 Tax=Mangrovibacterium marinum TaxID=1639118 RepID=A0A2T5C0R3_9BACT|nr:efflux RND transporter periplasmic adaptor subunit [Mangrovibacterium marinum]PTN08193.1 RND family efflux transporter MFP subunit [Mangrovibacterium marinum]
MKAYFVSVIGLALLLAACAGHTEKENHHDEEGHEHASEEHHHHADIHQQLIQYTDRYELFAETEPLVAGEEVAILAHLTKLTDFKPLQDDGLTAELKVGHETVKAEVEPKIPGIYQLKLKASQAGDGRLTIFVNDKQQRIDVPVRVYADDHEPHHDLEDEEPAANAVSFTKEQSWKVAFATDVARLAPIGQLIHTTARVESLPAKSHTLTAQTSGTVSLASNSLVAGSRVRAGQALLTISGAGMGDDNAELVYQSARADYQLAQSEYERMSQLAEKEIVSRREFQEAQNRYEKAKAKFDNLQQNFRAGEQAVYAALAGVLEKVQVQNGQHVDKGQPLVTLASYANVQLVAHVPSRYSSDLAAITALSYKGAAGSWQQIPAKLLSVGQRVDESSFRLPVCFEASNNGDLLPGSLIELNITCSADQSVVVVPNEALLEQQGNYFVYVQLNPELFEKRQVFPGASNGVETVVREGLAEGERIVTRGAVLVKLASVSNTLDPHAGHVH